MNFDEEMKREKSENFKLQAIATNNTTANASEQAIKAPQENERKFSEAYESPRGRYK